MEALLLLLALRLPRMAAEVAGGQHTPGGGSNDTQLEHPLANPVPALRPKARLATETERTLLKFTRRAPAWLSSASGRATAQACA